MDSSASFLPGALVRTTHGFIGTLERLEQHGQEAGAQPSMIVASQGGQQRYRLPVLLVQRVSQVGPDVVIDLAVESDDLRNYVMETVGPASGEQAFPAAQGAREGESGASETTLRIPLASEELDIRKEPVTLGHVQLHKRVETVEQSVNVPVYHEEVSVEHIPPDQYTPAEPGNPNELVIPIVEERLVIRKETVVKEYVRIRKHLVAEQQTIREPLRHEVADVVERYPDEGDAGKPSQLE